MDGGLPVHFDVETGFDDGTVRAHVRASLARGLPEVGEGPANGQHIHVYANGPSAADARRHYPAVALNGAYRLGVFRDCPPEYWVACDAQAMVAGFVSEPDPRTAYLVASKCHGDVFAALEGFDVSLWHVDDIGATALSPETHAVPTAVSVTICTLGLLYQMGWRRITVHGWDGCYIAGRDHAVAQAHNAALDVEVDVDGTVFQTTATWACEAEDALKYMALLPGLELRVTGPGMMAAIFRARGLG